MFLYRLYTVLLICALAAPLFFAHAHGQSQVQSPVWLFPGECANANYPGLATRTCCPSYNGQVCGGSSRGSCRVIDSSICDQSDSDKADSFFWFKHAFDNACVCVGNFEGNACEYCKPGWTGANCDQAAPLVVRQPWDKLDSNGKAYAIKAFTLLHSTPIPGRNDGVTWYQWFANLHAFASGQIPETWLGGTPFDYYQQTSPNFAHGGASFGVWHRKFVLMLERQMQRLLNDYTFALPYWDWYRDSLGESSYIVNTEFGRLQWMASCDRGCNCAIGYPFSNWKVYTTNANQINVVVRNNINRCRVTSEPNWLPAYPSTLTTMLGEPNFRELTMDYRTMEEAQSGPVGPSNQLFELAIHGYVHTWVGGAMTYVPYSASDPIFFLHHCMVDLVFELWLQQYPPGSNGIYAATSGEAHGHNFNECGGGLYPLSQHAEYWTSSVNLGYTYNFDGMDVTAAAYRQQHPIVMQQSLEPDHPSVRMQAVSPAATQPLKVEVPAFGTAAFGSGAFSGAASNGSKPMYCFDGMQDGDETGVDQGGSCGFSDIGLLGMTLHSVSIEATAAGSAIVAILIWMVGECLLTRMICGKPCCPRKMEQFEPAAPAQAASAASVI